MKQMFLFFGCVTALLVGCSAGSDADGKSGKDADPREIISSSGPETRLSPPDGPFGISMGEKITSIEATEATPGWYQTESPPRSHPFFPTVMIQATPSQGVCFVKGVSEDVATDRLGIGAKSAAEKIKAQLDSKYGAAKLTEFIMPGSLWDEPEDWTMGSLKGERFLSWEWKAKGKTGPWKDLDTVGLNVKAASTDTATITVEYYFTNSGACDREIERSDAQSL